MLLLLDRVYDQRQCRGSNGKTVIVRQGSRGRWTEEEAKGVVLRISCGWKRRRRTSGGLDRDSQRETWPGLLWLDQLPEDDDETLKPDQVN